MPDAALLAEALSLRAGYKVEISKPQRGEKREIMERALTNAREQLGRRMAENSAQRQLLEGVAEAFGLDAPPRRIEVYDNSHIQGAHAVGAFIVAGAEGFEKNQYRKFNIKSADLTPGDDYAMMREVLTRRFARLMKEEAEPVENIKWARPDLVLIDGGPGQLSIACQVFADLGVEDVALVGISKGPDRDAGREHFYLPARNPSAWMSKARCFIICNACATKRTVSPSAAIARSANGRSAPILWTKWRASAPAASALCCSISARRAPWRRPA